MTQPTTSKVWLTVREVRDILGLGRGKVYEILATEGEIETVQLGRSIRVEAASLNRWVAQQRYPKWREN